MHCSVERKSCLAPSTSRAVHYKVFDKDLEFAVPSVRPKSISYPAAKVGISLGLSVTYFEAKSSFAGADVCPIHVSPATSTIQILG